MIYTAYHNDFLFPTHTLLIFIVQFTVNQTIMSYIPNFYDVMHHIFTSSQFIENVFIRQTMMHHTTYPYDVIPLLRYRYF